MTAKFCNVRYSRPHLIFAAAFWALVRSGMIIFCSTLDVSLAFDSLIHIGLWTFELSGRLPLWNPTLVVKKSSERSYRRRGHYFGNTATPRSSLVSRSVLSAVDYAVNGRWRYFLLFEMIYGVFFTLRTVLNIRSCKSVFSVLLVGETCFELIFLAMKII